MCCLNVTLWVVYTFLVMLLIHAFCPVCRQLAEYQRREKMVKNQNALKVGCILLLMWVCGGASCLNYENERATVALENVSPVLGWREW